MILLGLQFDSIEMTITFPPEKLKELNNMVADWTSRTYADIHALRALLRKLLNVTQCFLPSMFLSDFAYWRL